MEARKQAPNEWIKLDLHIHTLDDPKDTLDYSAQQLLARARQCGIEVLAITLHDAVFDRPEVFAEAAASGMLLIPAAEVRLRGADIILLNVRGPEIAGLKTFADVRGLRAARGDSIFIFAPHPFYFLGGSIGGKRLAQNIDCFDAIEVCHFHKGWFDRNRPARRLAARFKKPLLATSDAHQLSAFGSHYTSIPRPPRQLTAEDVFAALRAGQARLTSPPCSWADLWGTFHFIFIRHPLQRWRRAGNENAALESEART